MEKKNQLKSCCKNNLSSPNTHHSSSRPCGRQERGTEAAHTLYPAYRPCGMTERVGRVVRMANSGFTLIELLVVVLIIGILTAVALPQYQQAVNKSRFANLQTIAKSFIDATKAYYLANGEYPQDIEELSIDSPAGMIKISPSQGGRVVSCAKNNEMYCCISKQGNGLCDSVVCGRNDYSFAFEYNHAGCAITSTGGDFPMCLAKGSNTNANKLCKSFGAYLTQAYLITPEGVTNDIYNFYTIQL